MKNERSIKRILKSKPTIEGAGVRLKRAFGNREAPLLDPFLLLDDFHSDNPEDYIAGFPWHPHRGIETITYLLHGDVEHGDSLGNGGVIDAELSPVQWMTAGSGIIHQEMPHRQEGLLWGFQLWANLPASHKMMDPRYRDITKEDIPMITLESGAKVKIICGDVNGTKGPVQDIITEPEYLDVMVPAGAVFRHPIKQDHTVFAYVIEGEGLFGQEQKNVSNENLVIFDDGNKVTVKTTGDEVRFLLISGKPIGEPIAWHGPIVMNTREELIVAFEEYNNGTFIKHGKKPVTD